MDVGTHTHLRVTYRPQAGFILVSILLLLGILSLSAWVAVEQSQFSYKINDARSAQIRARQYSEEGRLAGLKKLQKMLADTPQDIDAQYSDLPIDRIKKDGLQAFLSTQSAHAHAEIFLRTLPAAVIKSGTSLSQNMAYAGLGSGVGRYGSMSRYYELRAKGTVQARESDIAVWTASDIRIMPE